MKGKWLDYTVQDRSRLGATGLLVYALALAALVGVARRTSIMLTHCQSWTRWIASLATLLLPVVAAAVPCTLADLQAIAPDDTTIVAVELVAAGEGVPEYCRVDGYVTTPGNTVNFGLGLPSMPSWNRKLLFIGNGGFAGSIASLTPGLMRNYATASTDTGHQGSAIDASWALNNLPKKIDYAYRGVHVSAVAAKALTRGYYEHRARFSYFSGCSNGGRQAMQEVQRYPSDFDGVISGDPVMGALMLGFNWNQQVLLATPERYLPASKLTLITDAVLAECDAKDGLQDGLIDDPRKCNFDLATLQCPGEEAPDCLTAAQIDSVSKVYAGPTNSAGELLFPGFTVGSEAPPGGWETWINGSVPPFIREDGTLATNSLQFAFNDGYLRYLAFDDPTFDLRTFDFDTDPERTRWIDEELVPAETDLSTFRNHRGKLLMYHGWADPGLTPLESVDYYRDVFSTMSSGEDSGEHHRSTTNFFRLFMAPGMYHCAGGPGPNQFDTLAALEQWVEHGRAPTRIVASHSTGGTVDRTRPLCPYPQVERYTGKGSIDDEENFFCATPDDLDPLDSLIAEELEHHR